MNCQKCPAAKLIAGVVPQMHGSYCTIEEGFIPYTDSSYINFCIGTYYLRNKAKFAWKSIQYVYVANLVNRRER